MAADRFKPLLDRSFLRLEIKRNVSEGVKLTLAKRQPIQHLSS